MSEFKRRPIDPKKLEEFLSEAQVQASEKIEEEGSEESVLELADDTKLAVGMNVRFTQRDIEQLRYISKYVGISINEFIRMATKSYLPKALDLAKKRKQEKIF
jgi:hypothetical protein